MSIFEAAKLYETQGSGRIPNWTDALSIGLEVTIIGMVIVFAVLVILMLILKGMERFFAGRTEKKEEVVVPSANIAPSETVIAEEDEEELIAVLTAAIAASLNTSTYNLKIKSFKRAQSTAPAWNKAGLNDTINSRF